MVELFILFNVIIDMVVILYHFTICFLYVSQLFLSYVLLLLSLYFELYFFFIPLMILNYIFEVFFLVVALGFPIVSLTYQSLPQIYSNIIPKHLNFDLVLLFIRFVVLGKPLFPYALKI